MFCVNRYLDSFRLDKRTKDFDLVVFTVILTVEVILVQEFRVRIERWTSVWRFWWAYVYSGRNEQWRTARTRSSEIDSCHWVGIG